MKTPLTFLLICLITIAKSQTITVSEMIDKTKSFKFSDFNSFIVLKGFTLKEIDTSSGDTYLYKYYSDNFEDTLNDGYLYKTICILSLTHSGADKGEIGVLFQTRSKRNYLPLLKELENLEFKAESDFLTDESVKAWTTFYSSPNFPDIKIQIILKTDEKDYNNNSYTSYSIIVVRK